MIKIGQNIFKLYVEHGCNVVVKDEGEIKKIHSKRLYTLSASYNMDRLYSGNPLPIPESPVEFLPYPFVYCAEDQIEDAKKVLIDCYNQCQEKRREDLQKLLDSCTAYGEQELTKFGVWQSMDKAPKGATPDAPSKEVHILGRDKNKKQRVIWWTMEWPWTEGHWVYAINAPESIDRFYPVEWMPLPE